jgi:sugar O-acyltransferase (sialic acid O-acetyltransferase NeuD family)
MEEKMIAIYGAGGFGREVAWLAQSSAPIGAPNPVACFIDDDPALEGKILNGIPVLSLVKSHQRYQSAGIVSGIGVPTARQATMERAMALGFHFISLIHPRTEMSQWIEIGPGSVVCAGNILTTNIVLGQHVHINLDCTIGHDVCMADYVTLAPGVHVSGFVHIGKRAYIGTGAVIINGTRDAPLEIGDDAIVGAGACVTRSIPAAETWGGVPAMPLHGKGRKFSNDSIRKNGHAGN